MARRSCRGARQTVCSAARATLQVSIGCLFHRVLCWTVASPCAAACRLRFRSLRTVRVARCADAVRGTTARPWVCAQPSLGVGEVCRSYV